MSWRAAVASAVLAFVVGVPCVAQAPSGWAADASVGVSLGGGGADTHRDRVGLTLDGMLARRSSDGPLVLAVSGGARSAVARDVVCPGSCPPDMFYPGIAAVGALLGVQFETADGETTRLLAGPAYFHVEDLADVAGVQVRADLALPSSRRVALVLSLRGDLLPDVRGRRYQLLAGSVGLRFR